MITIHNHRAFIGGVPVEWRPSPNVGGLMEPQGILTHETVSHLTRGNAANWLCNRRSKVSAHVTIERDGSIIQLVDFNRVAWHAGRSEWQGRKNLNGFTVGIELVGPGRLYPRGDKAASSFGLVVPLDECVRYESAAHGGSAWWMPFTEAQIEACRQLCEALIAAYPRIAFVAGHYEVSPGRKTDPSPAFPMASFRALCGTRDAPDYGLVVAAQSKLIELGYDAGDVDGLMGPRTRGALRTFQDVNDLEITGELDAETATRLAASDATPMTTGTRVATTKSEAQPKSTWWAKRTTEGTAALEISSAIDGAQATVTRVSSARSIAEQFGAVVEWLLTPGGIKTVLVLILLGGVWFGIDRVDWQAVRARMRGLALGRA